MVKTYRSKAHIDDSDEPHDAEQHQRKLLLVLHAGLNRQYHAYTFIGVDDYTKQEWQSADWLELDDVTSPLKRCCVVIEDN